MLLEVVGKHLDLKTLTAEHKWIGLSQVDKIQLNFGRPVINPFCNVRCSEKDFSAWWQKKNKFSIFFKDASKGNSGNAGAGGLILYPGGKLQTSFSWGLGQLSHNQA